MTPISDFSWVPSVPKNTQAGFTLLEILLVLTIIGLASVLVVPNLTNLDSRSFDAQVRQATSLLNYARRFAVVSGQPAAAAFIITSADDSIDTPIEQETAGAIPPLGQWRSQGIQVRFLDSTGREEEIEDSIDVVFYPEGGSTGGTVFVSMEEQTVAIEIDPFTGRITSTEADE